MINVSTDTLQDSSAEFLPALEAFRKKSFARHILVFQRFGYYLNPHFLQ